MTRRRMVATLVGAIAFMLLFLPFLKWARQRVLRPRLSALDELKPLIEELVETVIPATDTPGAKEAGVADFVMGKVRFYLNRQEQNEFIEGLEKIERECGRRYGQSFVGCTTEQRLKLLEELELSDMHLPSLLLKIKRKLFGFSFIKHIKIFTVEGYCVSKPGATLSLNYQAVPVTYQPCIKLVTGQKAWATK